MGIRTRAFAAYRFHRSTLGFDASLNASLWERYNYISMKLYVGNLALQTTSEDLQQLFAQAGTVDSASVIEDRETGRSRGFGFVEISSNEEGRAAIQQLNSQDLAGRALNVNEAMPRESHGGSGGNRFGGGNRGGYGHNSSY